VSGQVPAADVHWLLFQGVAMVWFQRARKPAMAMAATISTISSSDQWRRNAANIASVTAFEFAATARSSAAFSASL
jgi:hypothetical protein